MRRARSLTVLLLPTLLASACAEFDREDRIEDLRILGVRTEPAELRYHPYHGFLPAAQRPPFLQLPTTALQVDVLAFDPRGGPIQGDISLCPAGRGVCNDFDLDELLLGEPEATREEVRRMWDPREIDEIVDPTLADEPAGMVPNLSYELVMTPAVVDSFIPDSVDPETGESFPLISFFPSEPRFVIDLTNPIVPPEIDVNREIAFKRFPVGIDIGHPDLPPEFKDALGLALGIDICDTITPRELFEEGLTDCFEPRPANNNPRLLGFDIDNGLSEDVLRDEGMRYHEAPDLGLRSLVSVAPGSVLSLTPVFPQDDVEGYQIVSFDIETQVIYLKNRFEDYAATWYTTRGDVSNDLTSLQFNGRLGVDWSLPVEVEPGERDQIVLVLLDQRGGTTWGIVTVEYR